MTEKASLRAGVHVSFWQKTTGSAYGSTGLMVVVLIDIIQLHQQQAYNTMGDKSTHQQLLVPICSNKWAFSLTVMRVSVW